MRVCVVTSIAVERDTRAYKFAASAARLGHQATVVEGEPSTELDEELAFELRSPPTGNVENGVRKGAPTPTGPSILTRLAGRVPRPFDGLARALAWPLNRFLVDPLTSVSFVLRSAVHDYRSRNVETAALLPDADLYWLLSFYQYPSVYRKARRLGARFFYDAPDAPWEPGTTLPPASRTAAAVLRVYEAIEKSCFRRAEQVTTVSDGLSVLLERRFGRRAGVIHNADDLRLAERSGGDLRAVTGVGPDDLLLVMVGNLKAAHAVPEAVEALRMLPDNVHLAFLGRGHEQSRQLAEEMGLAGRVHAPGIVGPTEVLDFIETADASPILYRPDSVSYENALPNGFFHAIAAGLPVLYPSLAEMKRISSEYELGVEIDPGDPASIAAAVRVLLDDPESIGRYRANVERARQVLNWEHEERVVAGLLEP